VELKFRKKSELERGPANGRRAKQNVRGFNTSVGARETVPFPCRQYFPDVPVNLSVFSIRFGLLAESYR
jgi:hypothetical protein